MGLIMGRNCNIMYKNARSSISAEKKRKIGQFFILLEVEKWWCTMEHICIAHESLK